MVLVSADRQVLQTALRHLHAQTAKERLEIVLVAPSRGCLGLKGSALEGFLQVRLIEVGEIRSRAGAMVRGIREASAPVVALLEDHCYPAPGWAAALIEAHRHPWGAVGFVIDNANPASIVSQAEHFISYGRWLELPDAGVVNDLPVHNNSYKRALIMDYGAKLEGLLEPRGSLRGSLPRALQAKGHQLYFELAATASHLNVSHPWSWLRQRFCFGRLFAVARLQNDRWSTPWRVAYVGGAPLIPLMHLRYLLPELLRIRPASCLLPKLLALLIIGLIAQAAGEAAGYSFGAGRALEVWNDFELNRIRYLRRADRSAV